MTDSGCQQCGKNTYSTDGASSCTSCPAGKVAAAGSTSAHNCSYGTVKPRFTGPVGEKELGPVNREARYIGVHFALIYT